MAKIEIPDCCNGKGDGAQTLAVGIPSWRTARYESGMRYAQFDIYELLRNRVGISNNARYQGLLNERHLRRCVVEQRVCDCSVQDSFSSG